MKKNLFRKETLDDLQTPGQINDFVKVSTPPLYIMLSSLTICMIVVLLWIGFGTVTEHVQAVAVVFPHATPHRIVSDKNGSVVEQIAIKGTEVEVGTPLLIVRTENDNDTLRANTKGRLISMRDVDEQFRAYETLAVIIPETTTDVSRELVTFVEYKDLRTLKPGLEVQVTPVDLHREDYGYIKGHITSVNHFPVNIEEAKNIATVRNFIDNIFPGETAYEVKLVVDSDPQYPDKLKWSREKSRDIKLSSLSFCNVQIITEHKPIYKVVVRN